MLKDRVEELLHAAFEEREDLFLIDFKVGSSSDIHIVIDGDKGVTLADCMFVSRAVEHQLDRDELDFSLEVTSAGATTPLTLPRQYSKNIGRDLQVEDVEGKIETGTLTSADDQEMTIEWKAREPKPIGKGKHTVEKTWTIPYSKVKQARVVIKF